MMANVRRDSTSFAKSRTTALLGTFIEEGTAGSSSASSAAAEMVSETSSRTIASPSPASASTIARRTEDARRARRAGGIFAPRPPTRRAALADAARAAGRGRAGAATAGGARASDAASDDIFDVLRAQLEWRSRGTSSQKREAQAPKWMDRRRDTSRLLQTRRPDFNSSRDAKTARKREMIYKARA